jgi:inward rectifier potassium channel
MHVIDDASPLKDETAGSLSDRDATFVLSVSGTDETTGQMLMARAEYLSADIRWNATFRDILEEAEDGTMHIDYSKFDEVVPFDDSDARRRGLEA